MLLIGWPAIINPFGRKNCVPIVLSISSIATAAERTGRASRRRIAVTKRAQTGSGIRNMCIPGARMLMMVVM
jgi:hypothetical protein